MLQYKSTIYCKPIPYNTNFISINSGFKKSPFLKKKINTTKIAYDVDIEMNAIQTL